MKVEREQFGEIKGQKIWLYTLTNPQKMRVQITNFGGIITSLQVPGRDGVSQDVVLGFKNLADYLGEHPHFGVIVGRYANRIAQGRFSLDGVEYHLARNEGRNHLHGGERNFGKVVWDIKEIADPKRAAIRLFYVSKDGEEGYPGNLETSVIYRLTAENELVIEYEAQTDQPTVLNLTNHSYFNLSGEGSSTVLQHEIMINGDFYTVSDEELIPTGEILAVKGTPLDFSKPRAIGERISELGSGGYDHNYVLNKNKGGLAFAAKVSDPRSGRVMEVFTTKPGLQFYTGNSLGGDLRGKSGRVYGRHSGFCLETQFFPDSPNQKSFPSSRLDPGGLYGQTTIYKFSLQG